MGHALIWDRGLIEAERELGLSAPPSRVSERVVEPAERIGQLPGLGDAIVRVGRQHVVKEGGARTEEPGDDDRALDVHLVELGVTFGEVDDAKPVAQVPVEDVARAE